MIKFRAWDKNTNDMVSVKTIDLENDASIGCIVDYSGINLDISECVLMQSTGLKDKNGVEIFEGDIVEVEVTGNFDYGSFIGVVEFLEGAWMVNNRINHARSLWSETNESEILGNIYANPELLSNP